MALRGNGRYAFALLLLVALLLGGCDSGAPKQAFQLTDISGAEFGRNFKLTDHNGKTRTLDDFKDKVVAVFFGYIFCPDVCPTTMGDLALVMKELPAPRESYIQRGGDFLELRRVAGVQPQVGALACEGFRDGAADTAIAVLERMDAFKPEMRDRGPRETSGLRAARIVHDVAAELRAVGLVQRPAPALAERRARGGNDHGFTHDVTPQPLNPRPASARRVLAKGPRLSATTRAASTENRLMSSRPRKCTSLAADADVGNAGRRFHDLTGVLRDAPGVVEIVPANLERHAAVLPTTAAAQRRR